MTLTVVGSIAFDAVETPAGSRDRLLGGSAVHFALASSFFAETRVVGPVGDDFGDAEYEVLHTRGDGHRRHRARPGRQDVLLGGPLPPRHQPARHAADRPQRLRGTSSPSCRRPRARPTSCSWPTSSPTCSARCASSATRRASSRMDSMNLWIDIARDVARAHDRAGRLPDPQRRRAQAAHRRAQPRSAPAHGALELGPRVVVAKQGEYGAAMFTREGFFGLPAYPTPDVVDPTGAGDSFAGGFVGYVAAHARRGRRRGAAPRDGLRHGAAPPSTSRGSATERAATRLDGAPRSTTRVARAAARRTRLLSTLRSPPRLRAMRRLPRRLRPRRAGVASAADGLGHSST